jgi:hypothetical protein
MNKICCDQLFEQINFKCPLYHSKNTICPDQKIIYNAKFDEYQLPLNKNEGIEIKFCPFCGFKLPESKRDEWFDEMKKLNIDPWTEKHLIPEIYLSDEWYKND